MRLVRVNIDNKEIFAEEGKTILEVAHENNIEIPHLCYDKRLKPYGACGLCVVEIEGSPKLARACSTYVTDKMVIKTDSPRVRNARKMALELLLSEHRGDCRPPCVLACPAHTDCQGYVGLIANGQFREAVALIKEQLPFPASIGRVCPHPCEEACRRNMVDQPIAIAELKRFVGDIDLLDDGYIPPIKPKTGKKVAIVGGGPAGLTCAFFLAKEGHDIVVYEAMPKAGGMLRYGIPEYRLPKRILDKEIELIEKMGVQIKTNMRLGADISLEYLRKNYDAVFLAVGAWKSSTLGCPGDSAEGVIGGIEFLRKVSMNQPVNLGQRVLVVGGGNTAMDAARTAIRLGAKEVTVLYRRTREEMPAEDIEVNEAEEEGVKFQFLVAPIEVITDGGRVRALKCQRMRLGDMDESGRRRPVPIEGAEVIFEADTIISAIGQKVRVEDVEGLELTRHGTIKVDEGTYQTSLEGVFAGGDAVTGPKIAIEAIAQGKNAARVIDSYLRGKLEPIKEPYYVKQEDLTPEDFKDRERKPRVPLKVANAEERKNNFREITSTMTEEEAIAEASRCLECGCMDYFECQLYKYVNQYDVDPQRLSGYKHKRYEPQKHPFIERNPDKCILCGLCIRVCEEVVGVCALGFVNRGFETIVKPEFGLPLEETSCISCGQCADICPTGACIGKQPVAKQVPVNTVATKTVCTFCGMGCEMLVETKGNLIFDASPVQSNEGMLCAFGRFGIKYVNDKDRILAPLIKVNGELSKTTFDQALIETAKKLQAIRASYGKDSIAIIASQRLTNEEALLLTKLAQKLDTTVIGSFNLRESVLDRIFGLNASTNSFDEIYSTDLIVAVGKVAENHAVMGAKLKKAVELGAKLVTINNGETRADEWAIAKYKINNTVFFKATIKALFEMKAVDEDYVSKIAVNLDELKDDVKNVEVTDEASEFAKIIAGAKTAMVIVDEDTVSDTTIGLLADILTLTQKIGRPRCGIIKVTGLGNTQGAWDMGIRMSKEGIVKLINEGKVKAAFIVSEDPQAADKNLGEVLDKLECLIVADVFLTETGKRADVVLPLVSHVESTGTVTRADGKIQNLNLVLKPKSGLSNLELLLKLAELFGLQYNLEKLNREMVELLQNENKYNQQILYTEGFATPDKTVHLFVSKDAPAFVEKAVFDTVKNRFEKYLQDKHLKY
ncbi:NAD(P)-binding protein [Caldicellulosiruptor sp. DIB 104C]|uniref:NAD(P)-binding protein n=1 Tax=Caldicellulosiruptor sp. DIB 104C TaxID=3019889 RepID=UPI002306C435|nr:NAD(P)-binding protein [Caldicellulosiruptor sp. DIB 104C]